jgi:hypothetical protein
MRNFLSGLTALFSGVLLIAGGAGSLELPERGRQMLGQAIRQLQDLGGSSLADWIERSRDDALAAGVAPVPPRVRAELAPHFPPALLDTARYRVGWPGELTPSAVSFRYGHADAITLGHVIVFKDPADAAANLVLWAHEITHVEQYRRWGMQEFARRYVTDHRAVEDEARRRTVRFLDLRGAEPWRLEPAG